MDEWINVIMALIWLTIVVKIIVLVIVTAAIFLKLIKTKRSNKTKRLAQQCSNERVPLHALQNVIFIPYRLII